MFNLSSRPSSSYIIYLDFDGNVVSGTLWNDGATVVTPPYETDGVEGSFSNAELRDMYEVWLRVSEDFMPFNVNVTTKKPTADQLMKSNAGDKAYGIHVAIGGSCDDWYKSSCGGVAYVGSFSWDSDTPCFVFPKNLHSAKNVAEAASHEIGHTLGLSHDGTSEQGYYGGADDWAPIMGVGYSQNLTQWSKGEYVDANNFEDDLAIITSNNGFDYRDDDHGNNAGRATPLTLVPVGALGSGVIEKNTDVDFFSFDVAGEKSVLTIGGVSAVTNLDALVKLYDSSRNLIATYDPLDAYYATVDLSNLDPGKYYLSVEGTGKIVDGKVIYTDYASLGAYTIKAVEAPSLVVTSTDDVVDEEDGVISLREAINYAGAGGLGSTITFDPSLKGKTLTITQNFTLNKAITIDASSLYDSANDAPGVAIDAKKTCGFFTTTASLSLKGIEFKNGKTTLHGSFDATGGFSASYCVFSDCEAAYGGVLKSDDCSVSIDHCLFENNKATNEGGALRLYNPTVVSVVDSVFKNNSGGNGGAFKLDGGTATIVDSTFVGNSSSNYGGAIHIGSTAQLKIVGAKFVDNATAADKVGGAVFNYGKLSLENSEFVGNRTGSMGGAIYTDGGEFKAVNSAFYANSASYGGAILTRSDSDIVNCTIAGNFSDKSGGGLFSDSGNVGVYNSIICSNFASFGYSDRYVAYLVGDSYNYLGDEPGFVVGPVFDANGKLTNAQSINLRLLENSPARNAGNNDYVSTEVDILGNPRICNNYVDIGAYE
ncbi:MAG: hypothetical protein J6X44_11260, partial [Thermoguttaceae bacterium]|nr:hypothetical protein [Thermoguttaceae bacterium]